MQKKLWPTPRQTDADRGGRGDLIQAVRAEADIRFRKFGDGATWVDFPMTQDSAQTAPTQAQIEVAENKDRELWREREGDYYADSLFVTEDGGIGMDCGGSVVVLPIREWFKLTGYKIGALTAAAEAGEQNTPTQAQIEAAAKAMEQDMFAPHELPLDDDLHRKYLHTAEAALTAAAEAGPPVNVYNSVYQEAIERCAQEAERYDEVGAVIAAAIRAMKEKP